MYSLYSDLYFKWLICLFVHSLEKNIMQLTYWTKKRRIHSLSKQDQRSIDLHTYISFWLSSQSPRVAFEEELLLHICAIDFNWNNYLRQYTMCILFIIHCSSGTYRGLFSIYTQFPVENGNSSMCMPHFNQSLHVFYGTHVLVRLPDQPKLLESIRFHCNRLLWLFEALFDLCFSAEGISREVIHENMSACFHRMRQFHTRIPSKLELQWSAAKDHKLIIGFLWIVWVSVSIFQFEN